MSLAQVVEKPQEEVQEIPKTVKNIIEFAVKHGVNIDELHIVKPTPRDPTLYIKDKPVASWIKL